MPLTHKKIESAKLAPGRTQQKLWDERGLYVVLHENGSKYFRLKYTFGGLERSLSLGTFPDVSLSEARRQAEEARALLRANIDPSLKKKQKKVSATLAARHTFKIIANDWFDREKKLWRDGYIKRVRQALDRDLLPSLGDFPIESIQFHLLRTVVQEIEMRPAPHSARKAIQIIMAIYRHAALHLDRSVDLPWKLEGMVKVPSTTHKTSLSRKQLSVLIDVLNQYNGEPTTKAALLLLMLTFVRPGEMRQAEWAEFDLHEGVWKIPKQKMKKNREHWIPLSPIAVSILKDLSSLTGNGRYLFPNCRDNGRPIGTTTLNRALEYCGFKGKFSAHGFRATASTLLNQNNHSRHVIEYQLAHQERSATVMAYNHADYWVQRADMMKWWSDYLCKVNPALALIKVT